MLTEFELIHRFFAGSTPRRADVVVGIGDDAAIVLPPAGGGAIVSACVTLHEGVDFDSDASPAELGRRVLEDGLRALAETDDTPPRPAWALLGLTLPEPDPDWTREFAAGLADACRDAGIELIGGDTTRGPRRAIVCMVHAIADAPSD